jgi:Arc/MetJ-type ribon-helix-helix transcriptional regulator
MSRTVKPLPDDDDALVKISVDVRAGGLRWVDQHVTRADNPHGSRTDVVRAALAEYAQRHSVPEGEPEAAPKVRIAKVRTTKVVKPGA